MEIESILKNLKFNRGTFPRQALAEAVARRDAVPPELLKIIKDAGENAKGLLEQGAYMAHLYAMFLLAQFREPKAYPLIVDFFSLPGDLSLDSTGDFVTENLGQVLASVAHGDASLMMSLVENEDANEYVRDAALRGLVAMVACGEISRDEIVDYFGALFREKFDRDQPSVIWSDLVVCSTHLHARELRDEIQQCFDEGLIDPFYMDSGGVERCFDIPREKALECLRQNRRYSLIEDTIAEMHWWACFKQPSQAKRKPLTFKQLPQFKRKRPSDTIQSRVETRRTEKVGRNAPCPCGSGKKFKKCCGR